MSILRRNYKLSTSNEYNEKRKIRPIDRGCDKKNNISGCYYFQKSFRFVESGNKNRFML